MTDHDDRPIVCMDCETEVQLAEGVAGTLVAMCECSRQPVKVSRKNPEGWT